MRVVDVDNLAAVLPALPDRPRLVVSGNAATPRTLVTALDALLPAYHLYAINATMPVPTRPGVVPETSFLGPGMRRHPALAYVPSRLSLVPRLFATTLPPDLVVLHTSAPIDGKVSLGIEVNVLPAAVEAARARGATVIAEVNARMPYTFGDAELSTDLIDLAIEVDEPLPEHGRTDLDEASLQIGERVAGMVPDGATLQLGIGAVPDAVLRGLPQHRGLRVWSEMFSDGVLFLDRKGALDPDALIQASFLFGTTELYEWVHRNPRVRLLRTETTNEPALIGRNHAMTSINTGLQVDLFGQVNASRIGARIYSGFGGQTDFIVGALHSPGGQAIMALRSWHPKADISTIVPLVDEPVTSFQASAVVTEQGSAELFGRSEREQAAALIDHAAHPRVRDELREEAVGLGLA